MNETARAVGRLRRRHGNSHTLTGRIDLSDDRRGEQPRFRQEYPMTDECISPLRRRMIEDMTVRNFVVKTQTDYIRRVKSFAVFLGRSPDTATREDVRRYLLHLASSGMGAATVNCTGSALRFLFDITLDR